MPFWYLVYACIPVLVLFVVDGDNNFGEGIYGNAGVDYADGMNALVFYDSKTGHSTTVSPPPNGASLSLNEAAAIDQINGIYYYLTVVSTNAFLAAYNLSYPSTQMNLIQLSYCNPVFEIGAGTGTFTANPLTGDIFMYCMDAVHYKQNADLFKLHWLTKTEHLNATLIETYNVGGILSVTTVQPIFDSKRNNMWVLQSYGTEHNITSEFNAIDVINGSIINQINGRNWTLITGIYSQTMDKIISMEPYNIVNEKTLDQYLGINLTYNDPVTTKRTNFIGSVNISKYYCSMTPAYTMDDMNGIWYHVMYRNPDNSSCLTNNKTYEGDLVSIDIKTGEVLNEVHICEYGPGHITCPLSIKYWYNK